MDDALHEPVMVSKFLRRHFVRIVIGAALVLAACFAVSACATYLRQWRFVHLIKSDGGIVSFVYCGPAWIPQPVRDRMPFLVRMDYVAINNTQFTNTQFTDADLEHLKGLTSLTSLSIAHTQVTDAGLVHLKGLTKLKYLYLFETQVTDSGLKHLKGLTNLEFINLGNTHVTDAGLKHLKVLSNLNYVALYDTQVTVEGRKMLRKTLPMCQVVPGDG